MKRLNFPFTAIIGQDRMRLALILNVIDPGIGGVLLTGHQGTGKSTAVRALADILPDIEAVKDCPFSCDPKAPPEMLCDSCRERIYIKKEKVESIKKQIPLVDLPLGVTEDMVCGSLDLERVLKEGIKSLHPGLLAKANRGILYIDEINLLQDHIVDILLDAAASGVNIIEREGVSISHPARFVLVGSMNPEEGELRPQINDRLGLEVTIDAPRDPEVRAEVARRVIEFNDDPIKFIKKYEQKQLELQQKIINAKKILKQVKIPVEIYKIASEIVVEIGIQSQRADITFIRCARANAAFRGSKQVEMIDLDAAIDLVFEHRLRAIRDDIEPEEIHEKIKDIYGKIKEAYESTNLYRPNKEQEGPLKSTNQAQSEFKRQPFDPDKVKGLPETQDQRIPENDEMPNSSKSADGIKVADNFVIKKFSAKELKPIQGFYTKKITNIMSILRNQKKRTDFVGRGARTKVTSSQKGRYITFKYPVGKPKNIAFDASIKRCLIRSFCKSNAPLSSYRIKDFTSNLTDSKNKITSAKKPNSSKISFYCNTTNLKFPILMKKEDIMEKVFEFKAPLSIYFILDASGSMKRYMNQMADVIRAVHTEGYKKKDKMAVLVFRGRKAHILQRPTSNVSRIIPKLASIEGTSYTPLASALIKSENLIKAEKMKNKDIIPIVVICSDLGANVSLTHPNLKPQVREDWTIISEELKSIAKKYGQKNIKILVIKPKKGYPTRFLGIEPFTVEKIEKSFKKYAKAEIFEFEGYNPQKTIIKIKKIL
ncbi:MAG: ATP-binding protein [Promethearchaeota archaeon]